MKNKENKELLTPSLYMQISTDKNTEISNLKTERTSVIEKLKQLKAELKEAKEAKKAIKRKIRLLNHNILTNNEKKFALSTDLKVQRKLANKLNNEILKEDSYICVNNFYPENAGTKKR